MSAPRVTRRVALLTALLVLVVAVAADAGQSRGRAGATSSGPRGCSGQEHCGSLDGLGRSA